MKLEAEHIEQVASYMADSLEDHLDIIFWDSLIRMLTDEFNIEYECVEDISDEDIEAIVQETRLMFAPKND
tara:strand:+ start:18 stop:230 length:213 start_codon:yes stop_codon:yes gene_type:complete